MRRSLMVLALLLGAAAYAQEGEHGDAAPSAEGQHAERAAAEGEHGSAGQAEENEKDPPTYIMHHVRDDNKYTFEIPLNSKEDNPTLVFPTWRIPLAANACPADQSKPASLLAGCLDISITKHVMMMWIAAFLLLLTFFTVAQTDKNKRLVPMGAGANMLEMLVLFVRDEIAIPTIGKEYGLRYTPYLLTVFFFILFMNLLGLFPWMATPTGNLGVTLALALCTFFLTQAGAIRAAGFGTWLKHLTGGVSPLLWIIMIPVEVLGLFTKPFALTVRLFANMLAGHIVIFFLLGLIFILKSPGLALVSVPFAMGIYLLEIFVAFVQAYIFTILSSLFIGMGVAMAHHGDDHGHAEGGASHDHGAGHQLSGS